MNVEEREPIYKPTIQEHGITLSEKERQMIAGKSMSLNKTMATILKNRPGKGLNYGEMILLLEQHLEHVNIDTVRRGLSEMTGTKGADESMKDKYGRWPIVKLKEKRLNPYVNPDERKQIRISLYAWNTRYGKPKTNSELLAEQKRTGQMDFYDMAVGR